MELSGRVLATTSFLILAALVAAPGCGAPAVEDINGAKSDATADSQGEFGGANADGGTHVAPADCSHNQGGGDPNKDYDGDGFALKDDCNECDVNSNRGAYDVPGNGIDEDCSGKADDDSTECDDGLALDGTDAFDGAKAIGLCKRAKDDKMWGVLKAEWVTPDGKPQPYPLSEGILSKFGVNTPLAGKRMLAISSGAARDPSDPGYEGSQWSKSGDSYAAPHGTPAGYPKASKSCLFGLGSFGYAYDGAALRVTLRVPSNAKSFSYEQNFFTSEFPTFICRPFNDFFVTMMTPKPANLPDGNIAFDQDNNPISVNNSFLQVCQPQVAGLKPFACPLTDASLSGTGYEAHAASGWLTTTAPVEDLQGKELTLMWAIWDQGDGLYDSTALIDGFTWSAVPASAPQTKPKVVK